MTAQWTAKLIGRALAMQVFNRNALVVVPNCSWPGSECDLLVVRPNLRLVDIEVKISRADLKREAKKEKWLVPYQWHPGQWLPAAERKREPVLWPAKAWKHFYALPESIWTPELTEHISPKSGIILMRWHKDGHVGAFLERQAKPNKDALPLTHADVIDIARVASLRMWEAYEHLRTGNRQEVA